MSTDPKNIVTVPRYPSGAYTYRKDARGWLVSDENGFRGSLLSHQGDPIWMLSAFASALDLLALRSGNRRSDSALFDAHRVPALLERI